MRHVWFGLKATVAASGFVFVGWRAVSDGTSYAIGVGVVLVILGVLLWFFNLYWLGLGAEADEQR